MTKPPISLCYFNHSVGARSLVGMRHFLMDGFRDLGFDITFSERIEPGKLMVCFDYFANGIAKTLLDAKVDFIVVATEIPTTHPTSKAFTLNNRTDMDWGLRAAGLMQVLPKARGILSMDPRPETLEAYRQFGVPVAPLGVGYSKTLHAETTKWTPEQDLDFCFTGVDTPYRMEVIHALRKKAVVGYLPGLLPFEQMCQMLRRSKCNLALKLERDWPLPSFTRIMSLLHAERPALADVSSYTCPPVEMIPQIEMDELIRDPMAALNMKRSITPTEALEQLKDTRPAAKVVGEAWEQVMG